MSRQVHDLEEELGFRLFERSTTKVRLTEAGRFFQQQVGKLLMQLDIAVTGAQRIAKGTKGDFRIGTDWSASGLFITDAAHELHLDHPGLSIDFIEMPDHEHTQAVRDQKIDVGFVSGVILTPRKDIDFCLIYVGAIKAVLPMEHPLAAETMVRLRDLKGERWIALGEEDFPGAKVLLTQFLKPAQFSPRFGRTAQSVESILAFVGTGEGVSLLPEIFLPPKPAGLRYVDTDSAPWEIYAVWSNDDVNEHVPAYLEILRRKIGTGTIVPAGMPGVPGRINPKRRTVRSK